MNNYPNARDCEHGQLARACEICELQARLAECERENAALKDIPTTVYEAVDRVLDEESAWIARPSPSVTRRVALSATIACSVAWNESFENAVRREQAMQGMRDYVSQLEDTCDTLRAQLAETQKQLEVQLAVGDKLTAEIKKHEEFEASMRCPQCDLLRLEIGELIGDAEIGRRWRSNSSLEEWFPLSAEELKSAKADVTRINKLSRMALSQKVSIVDTGVIPYRACLNGQVLGDSLREVIDKAIIYPPEE